MTFKGTPGMTVTIRNPRHLEVKQFHFDGNGLYETNHPITIQRLKNSGYAPVDKPNDASMRKCGVCGASFDSWGLMMAHRRKEHPKPKEN
jgi:Na+-transporting NADH:ubiquinone oxidoreductase subunit NqrC